MVEPKIGGRNTKPCGVVGCFRAWGVLAVLCVGLFPAMLTGTPDDCPIVLAEQPILQRVPLLPRSLIIHRAKPGFPSRETDEPTGWLLEMGVFPQAQHLVPERLDAVSVQSNPGIMDDPFQCDGFGTDDSSEACHLNGAVAEFRIIGKSVSPGTLPPGDLTTPTVPFDEQTPSFVFEYPFVSGAQADLKAMKEVAGQGLEIRYIALQTEMFKGYLIKELWRLTYSDPRTETAPKLEYMGRFAVVGHRTFADIPSEHSSDLSELLGGSETPSINESPSSHQDVFSYPKLPSLEPFNNQVSSETPNFEDPPNTKLNPVDKLNSLNMMAIQLEVTFQTKDGGVSLKRDALSDHFEKLVAWRAQSMGLAFNHGHYVKRLSLHRPEWVPSSDTDSRTLTMNVTLSGGDLFLDEIVPLLSEVRAYYPPQSTLDSERGIFVGHPVTITVNETGRMPLQLQLPEAPSNNINISQAATLLSEQLQASSINLGTVEVRKLTPEELSGTVPIQIDQKIWSMGAVKIARLDFICFQIHNVSQVDQLKLPQIIAGFPIVYTQNGEQPSPSFYPTQYELPGMRLGGGLPAEAERTRKKLLSVTQQLTDDSTDAYATTLGELAKAEAYEGYTVDTQRNETDEEIVVVVVRQSELAKIEAALKTAGRDVSAKEHLETLLARWKTQSGKRILLGIRN